MGLVRVKAAEGKDKEIERWLKKQFINGVNDQAMMKEIITELTAVKNTGMVRSG